MSSTMPTADWRMSGNGEDCTISASGLGDYTVELEAEFRKKPAVLHHGSGLVDLGVAGKTYYYSRTRLESSGTVTVSGVSHAVTREFPGWTTSGENSPRMGIGWDWLSLNLGRWLRPDGLRGVGAGRAQSHQYLRHLRASRRFDPIHLPGNDISLDSGGTWTSSCRPVPFTPYELEVASRLAGARPVADCLDGGGRIRPEHIHPRDLLGGIGCERLARGNGTPVAGRGFVEMVGYAPAAPEVQSTPSVQP